MSVLFLMYSLIVLHVNKYVLSSFQFSSKYSDLKELKKGGEKCVVLQVLHPADL